MFGSKDVIAFFIDFIESPFSVQKLLKLIA